MTSYGGVVNAFNQADVNHDGSIDQGEFRSFVGNNAGAVYGTAGLIGAGALGATGLGGVSSYESYSSSSSGLGADAGLVGAAYGTGLVGDSVYQSSSYSSNVGTGLGYAGDAALVGVGAAGVADAGYNAAWSQYGAAVTGAGLYNDAAPQIIRRPAGAPVTYQQNIRVRFLQPPPVAPHGPLIIREVRPPQPPVLPPLRVRQVAPQLPQPPPLVLRERPPIAPQPITSQTVIRRLPAIPLPPRSVIIERLPPLPPRPRDVVIERWLPYGPLAARRTLLQRAGPAPQYPRPQNIIIQYEQAPARVVRQFQRLGVSPASPAAYVGTYGASLLDTATLLAQARSAGVVEDISPPGAVGVGYSAAAYGQDVAYGGLAYGAGALAGDYASGYSAYESSGVGLAGAGYGLAAGAGYGGVTTQDSVYESSGIGGTVHQESHTVSSGAPAVAVGGLVGAAPVASSVSYPIGLDVGVAGLTVNNPAAYEQFAGAIGATEQHGYGVGADAAVGAPNIAQRTGRYDAAGSMFNYADADHNNRLDVGEFSTMLRSL